MNWTHRIHHLSNATPGQSLGSMILAFEALFLFTPDIFFDTTGYAFSFPVASSLFGTVTCLVQKRMNRARPKT